MRGFATSLLLLSLLSLKAQSPADPLLGRWRSAETSPAGVVAIFSFLPDHQVETSSAVLEEQTFRLLGTDTILLKSNGKEKKWELEWDNPNRARIEDESAGVFIHLARDGKMPDPKNRILGEWTTEREWQGKKYPARAVFSANGAVLWIVAIRSDRGRFSTSPAAQGANVRLQFPGRPVVEGAFSLEGGRLNLPNPKGGQSAFQRL